MKTMRHSTPVVYLLQWCTADAAATWCLRKGSPHALLQPVDASRRVSLLRDSGSVSTRVSTRSFWTPERLVGAPRFELGTPCTPWNSWVQQRATSRNTLSARKPG